MVQQYVKNQGRRHTGRLELRGKKWLAVWMIDGKRYSGSTGCEDRAEAQKWLDRKLASYRTLDALRKVKVDEDTIRSTMKNLLGSRLTDAEQKRKEIEDAAAALTFERAWDEYVDSPKRKRVTEHTLTAMRCRWRRFSKWIAANHPEVTELRQVTKLMAEDFAKILRREYVPDTYNITLSALQQFWSRLSDKIGSTANPWTKENLARDGKVKSERRPLTDAEIEIVFREAKKTVPPLHRLFTTMLFTGARLGDAACLTWESVNLQRAIITFIPEKTKRFCEAARVKIPILPPMRAMLEATPAADRRGYVMPDMAESYRLRKLNKIVTRFLERNCGFETRKRTDVGKHNHTVLSAHSFRHTFVSLAANAGVPFKIVEAVVGHQCAASGAVYFHDDEAATRKAFEVFPQIEDKGGEVIDVEATVTGPTRLDELKRLLGEIVKGGDADELAAARAAMVEVMK